MDMKIKKKCGKKYVDQSLPNKKYVDQLLEKRPVYYVKLQIVRLFLSMSLCVTKTSHPELKQSTQSKANSNAYF